MSKSHRTLLVGGRGWIGTALRSVLEDSGTQVMATSSAESLAGSPAVRSWVSEFAPSAVVFLAGVTPDRGMVLGLSAYERALGAVTDELMSAMALPGIESFTYLSSGVVQAELESPANPYKEAYRAAKVREESLVEEFSDSALLSVARVFSLSGPFARDPQRYAIFDLIAQALTGRITITSTRLVYRSYVSVLDLAEAMARSLGGNIGGLWETGGDPLELATLAERIIEVVNPSAELVAPSRSDDAEVYVGSDIKWRQWCARVGLQPHGLTEQITMSLRWIEACEAAEIEPQARRTESTRWQ